MRGIGLGLLLAVAGVAGAQGFSVEQALFAPFSNQLTAAPARARVAWFTDAEGRRNVWIAGPHEAARQMTHYTEDDGQDIDNLAWSADAEQIAWTRGTGAQGSEHTMAANPAELPGPVKQNVEFADLRTGAVRVVAEGHAPLFLNNGSALLFLRRGNIWIAELGSVTREASSAAESQTRDMGHTANGSGELPGVRQLVYVRGSASGLRLSPDGRLLLFVSNRGDHSFIGVFDLTTKQLRWMDPGVGLDHDAVWSPDGKRIAFVREVPIVSPIADRWMREGAPWSIRIAEVATGAGSELWRAGAGAGSVFHGLTAKDQLLWMGDGRIVFPWEKGGWTRLYAVRAQISTASKPQPEAVSPAEAEVDCVAGNGARIVWSSNDARNGPEDVDRRHIFSDGRNEAMLTDGQGIETEPVILSDGTLAIMRGGAGEPLVPALLTESGKQLELAPQLVPSGFPAAQFVTPRQVIFKAADGLQIHGQLFLPRGHRPGQKLPAVVFFHGGSRRQMLLGFHPMQYYAQTYEFNQYLASRGFAVLSVNYRSGTGYGLNFRQALNYGANGASEYNDAVGAARYLQSRDDIDGKRIGAWGGSYGGYLTALALARNSDLYAAGVDLHGVHDWSLELDLWKPWDDPDVDQAAIAKRAYASSPMADVKRWKSPVLLIQGDDDRNVLFSQTVRLAAALRAQGVPVEEKVFPDEVHDFLLHRNWITSYGLAAGFLERTLTKPVMP